MQSVELFTVHLFQLFVDFWFCFFGEGGETEGNRVLTLTGFNSQRSACLCFLSCLDLRRYTTILALLQKCLTVFLVCVDY